MDELNVSVFSIDESTVGITVGHTTLELGIEKVEVLKQGIQAVIDAYNKEV